MRRELIHPELPFTEEEYAAAWILLGTPADEAIRTSAQLKAEFAAEPEHEEIKEGWSFTGPRVRFFGNFGPAIHLAADIASNGTVLSDTARDAWLEKWDVRLAHDEAERRVDELAQLGQSGPRAAPCFSDC